MSATVATERPDLIIRHHGSVVGFGAQNDKARQWLESLGADDWQWMGRHTLYVDWRQAIPLVELAREEGFIVR